MAIYLTYTNDNVKYAICDNHVLVFNSDDHLLHMIEYDDMIIAKGTSASFEESAFEVYIEKYSTKQIFKIATNRLEDLQAFYAELKSLRDQAFWKPYSRTS